MQMNKAYFSGNLGADAVDKAINNGSGRVVEFSLCESYKTKNGDVQNWMDVAIFGDYQDRSWRCDKAAAFKKGDNVFVVGKIISKTYEDKNGVKRKNTYIDAEIFDKFEKKPKEENAQVKPSGNSIVSDIPLEDVPF